jgi:hypothetical protein
VGTAIVDLAYLVVSSQHISEIGLYIIYIKGSPNSHTLCITDGFENPTQRNGFLNKCLKVMTTTSLRYGTPASRLRAWDLPRG